MRNSIVFTIILFLSEISLIGQDNPSGPSTPNAGIAGKSTEINVNYNTGTANFTVPIYTLSEYDISVPIFLSYQTGGIKVAEVASSVGLGWNLQAGGLVSRSVRDIKDEDSQKGFFQVYGEGTNVPIADADTESDIYYFNFNGTSGKFFFNTNLDIVQVVESDILIEPITSPISGAFVGWELTTPDGYKYIFGYLNNELVRGEIVNGNMQYWFESTVSEWYLVEIQSPSGHSVQFEYVDERYFLYNVGQDIVEVTSPCINDNTNSAIELIDTSIILSKRISAIRGTYDEVIFSSGDVREDLHSNELWFWNGISDLDEEYNGIANSIIDYPNNRPVEISGLLINVKKDGNWNCLKKIEFDQSYFNSSLQGIDYDNYFWIYEHYYSPEDFPDLKRLKLNGVVSSSCNSEYSYETSFTYTTDSIPRRLSHAQDYWGYFNGANNNISLIPNLIFESPCFPSVNCPGGFQNWDNNRQPSWPEMSFGSLSGILYPSGLNTQIEYESHRVNLDSYKEVGSEMFTIPTLCIQESSSGCNSSCTEALTYILQDVALPEYCSIELSFNANIYEECSSSIGLKVSASAPGMNNYNSGGIRFLKPGTNIITTYDFIDLVDLEFGTNYDFKFELLYGGSSFNHANGEVSGRVLIKELGKFASDEVIGGTRIKSISDNRLKKRYKYEKVVESDPSMLELLFDIKYCNEFQCGTGPNGPIQSEYDCTGSYPGYAGSIVVPCDGEISLSLFVDQDITPTCYSEPLSVELSWDPIGSGTAASYVYTLDLGDVEETIELNTTQLESYGLLRGFTYNFFLTISNNEYGRTRARLIYSSNEQGAQQTPGDFMSSGIIANPPIYISYKDKVSNSYISYECYEQNSYYIYTSSATSLNTLFGGHILYGTVKEYIENVDGLESFGYTEYKYDINIGKSAQGIVSNLYNPIIPLVTVFPPPPELVPLPSFGSLLETKVFNSDEEIVMETTHEYLYKRNLHEYLKYAKVYNCVLDYEQVVYHPYSNAQFRILPKRNTQTMLGVKEITEFEYNEDYEHLNPISITKSVEGDPNIVRTDMLYAHEKNNSLLLNNHIIGIPLETVINGGAGGGSRVDYDLISGSVDRILPVMKFRALNDGSWKEIEEVISYTNEGLPEEVEAFNTDVSTNTWDDGLLIQTQFESRINTYTYYSNRLLHTSTNYQGIDSEYSYDSFNRLAASITKNDRVETTYSYFVAQVNGENRVNSVAEFQNGGSSEHHLPDWETNVYYDEFGRETKTTRLRYTQSGGDYTTGQTYGPLGKVFESCDPGKGGCDVMIYSNSPLRRLLEFIPAGSPKSVYSEYGSNSSAITIGSLYYPANTLYMSRVTDENGIITETYTDFRGRTILVLRDQGGLNAKTHYRYDDRNNILEVYPPGSSGDGNAKNFIYSYSNEGLLEEKAVPDEGTYTYDSYNVREQLLQETTPYGDVITYVYDGTYPDFLKQMKVNGGVAKQYTQKGITGWIEEEDIALYGGTMGGQLLNTSYTLDDLGRPTSEEREFVYGTSTYGYTYDDADNVRLMTRTHSVPDLKDISYSYEYLMPNGIRVDQVDCSIGGLETLSKFTYSENDWLMQDEVGDGLHTISYGYNPRGWLKNINGVSPPPPTVFDDCLDPESDSPDIPHTPFCIPIDGIVNVKILYNCSLLSTGDTTAVNVELVTSDEQEGQFTLPMYGYEGGSNIQPDSISYTLSGEELTDGTLQALLEQLLATCTGSSEGSIKGGYDINSLIQQILELLAQQNGSDLFGEKIHYFEGHGGLEAPRQYNGNISWVEWKVAGEPYQMYGYDYDGLNRLIQARYKGKITLCEETPAKYDVDYGYDIRGNMTSIQRYGYTGLQNGVPTYDVIDNLSFTPTGANMISGVSESANTTIGFKGSSSTYTYETGTGRLISDSGKSISSIIYNWQNQALDIQVGGKNSVKRVVDANGTLHKMLTYEPDGTTYKERIYAGGIEYFEGKIESIYHEEGRYVYERDESGELLRQYHEFSIGDHLGNTRVRFADLNGDMEINLVDGGPGQEKEIFGSYHYYPYGMLMEGIFHPQDLVDQPYQYNGIEYLSHAGLDVNLATWRTLDPCIGRWWSVDPKAELGFQFTPYNSMQNNPTCYSDPEGDWIHIVVGAAIGAAINVATHWDHITEGGGFDWGAFGKAALIGGGAGAITAATGGAAAGALGLGTTGIASGLVTGGVGAIYGSPIQGIGNAIAFGDEYSVQRWGLDIIGGAVIGGVVSGAIAGLKGQNLWWGNTPRPTIVPPGNIEFPDGFERFKGTNSKGQTATVEIDDPLFYANEHIKGINTSAQLKHVPGSHNYDPARSPLLSDPDELLKKVYTLDYEFVRYNIRGQAVVKFNHPVGFYIQNGVNKGVTNLATIHAKSNGLIHFVPAWP